MATSTRPRVPRGGLSRRNPTRRGATGGRRAVVEYYAVRARSFWRAMFIVGVTSPVLYALALGVGLGTVVDRNSDALGVPYLVFVAPAFLTAAALQIGASEASYPLLGGFKWQRTFHGMAATPVRPGQIADGSLIWIGLRLAANSALYLAIMAAFGGIRSLWTLLAIPVATLTGLAFAAPVAALSATLERENNAYNVVFRFIVTPMFLFSGTFYPIDQLPRWGQALAWASPLWHGTELARDSALHTLSVLAVLGHLAYLLTWLSAGVALARWRFRVRLTR